MSMALITCIECGKEISSFAEACPYCGCPASVHGILENKNKNHELEDRLMPKLKNQEKWDEVFSLVQQKRGGEAHKEMECFAGKSKYWHRIILAIDRTGELPVDLILEIYPDQALNPIVKEEIPIIKLKPCSACNRNISVQAETCPH